MILLLICAAALALHVILCLKGRPYYGAVIPMLYIAAVIAVAVMYEFRVSDLPSMAAPLVVLLIIWYICRRFRKK